MIDKLQQKAGETACPTIIPHQVAGSGGAGGFACQAFFRSLLPVAALGLCALLGATEPPSITPQVSSVFPHGGLRGSEVSVEFRGAYLNGASEIRFTGDQVQGTVDAASFRSIRARFRIAADAEAGRHDFRLITPHGAWFGLFWVGTLAESIEIEPNDRPAQAQRLALPAVINGRADGADADYFRFRAEAGQTIVFDVTATRLGSSLDPALTLFDERGRELAYNDDAYIFKDAQLVHTFERAGEYTILVSASFERSSRDAEYRLLATTGPFAKSALPLGARRGGAAELLIHGWNLDRVDRVWLGRRLAQGRVLDHSPRALRVHLDVPASVPVGSYQLHLASGDTESPVPLRFEIGDLPEVTVSADAPASQKHAFPVPTPAVINGTIPITSDRIARAQWLEFEAAAGGRYEFKVDAWKLGECFDPVITLFDAGGRILAKEDDPAPNSFIHHPATHDPRLVYVFPQAGRYRLQIRDAAYEGGSGYRLTIHRTQPDFELEVRSPQLTVYAGRQANLLAVVRRTGGVHEIVGFRKPDNEIEQFRLIEKDGWNTPIRVSVEGLPEGVTAEPVTAEPRNTIFKGNDGEELFVDGALAEIPVRVSAQARGGLYPIRVRASGSFEGKTVEREAVALNGTLRSLRHEPTRDQKLYLNVIQPPALLWNAPAELRISKGGAEVLRAGFVRMDGKYRVSVEPKSQVAGFTVGAASAAETAEEVELPVTALGNAGTAPVELILVATFERNGRMERIESPPIELRVKP